MSMWRTNPYRSPCEVLREINDLFQDDTAKDKYVRKLLAECEVMSKDMSIHLTKYEPNYHKKWKSNVNANADIKFRERKEYKFHKI